MVEMAGIDVLFALLRRKNHTELLPQLPSLKTVRRTVFFTLVPFRVRFPLTAKKKASPGGGLFFFGGDGGNRTRVRKFIHTMFYERSRSIEIPAGRRRPAGSGRW